MHKKYLESLETTVPHDLPPKKIIPHTLFISPTFPLAGPIGQNFFKSFLVKRKYCRNILDESQSDHGMGLMDRHLQNLRKVILKMKYLRSIQIISCLASRYLNNYQVMCGVCSMKIEFIVGIDSCLDTTERIRKQFKEFARFDLVKLKIEIFCCTSFSITEVVAKIIEGLRSMSNIKEFRFEIQMSHILGGSINFKDTSKKQISSKIPLQLKRLNKIEKLQIIFQDPAKQIPESLKTLADDFNHLRNLKSVTCLAIDLAHSKRIIGSLYKLQMLTSVTLYHFFEPDDILLLAMKLPNLKSVTIKDDWLITSKDIPSLSLVDCNGLNILQLNIEVPLSIYSKDEVQFVCDFLSAFRQIRSLSLSIESGGNEFILGALCQRIGTFSHLEQLKLGILVTNKGILSQFLSGIDTLTNLKKISLTLKREFRQKWDCEIQEISHTLKSFIQQSKELEELSINWDKFTEKCAECLKTILSEINNLNSFCLAYFPGSKKHGKEHESILKAIEGLFIKTTTEIKKVTLVTLVTQCDTSGDFKCNYKLGILKSVLENNVNIKEFLHYVNFKTALDDDHFV